MQEMRCGEGRYIAGWFAQRWEIEAEVKAAEDAIPRAQVDEKDKAGLKGGAAFPIGEFLDDPATEARRLRGELDHLSDPPA
jgi:hypothetical protein